MVRPGPNTPINIGWGDSQEVCPLYGGCGKKNRQMSNRCKILGCAEGELTQDSLYHEHWCRENPGMLPKMAQVNACTYTHSRLPGKQQSTGWKNMVTDALKLRTLRACRDILVLKTDTPRGKTPQTIQRVQFDG